MIENTVLFLMFDMPTNASTTGSFQAGAGTWLGGLYLAGFLNVNHPGKDGQNGGDAETIDVDTDVLLDGNAQIVGRVETRDELNYYRNQIYDQLRVLVGLGKNLGIYGSVTYLDYGYFGSYSPTYTFPAPTNWSNPGWFSPSAPAQTVTVTDNDGTVISKTAAAHGDGYIRNFNINTDVGVGVNLPLGESNLALKGVVGFDVVDYSEFAAGQSYTSTPGSDTGTSFTPTIGEGGEQPVAVAGVTSYSYDEYRQVESYLNINPQIDIRFLFPSTETVSLEGGWVLDANFRLYSGSYADATGATANAAGSTATYTQTSFTRTPSSIGTAVDTTQIDYAFAADRDFFDIDVSLPMAARFTPSEQFRFGLEYVPTVHSVIQSTSYTGQTVERVTYEDGDGVDSANDATTVTTVTAAGYSESYQSFEFRHSLSTAAQFFLIPGKLRVNLGAQVNQSMADRADSKTETTGMITYQQEVANGTADAAAEDLIETVYSVNTEVRNAVDFSSALALDGAVATVDYDAGFTFFFDENMFLDFNLDSAGNIWDVNRWSLDMTILQ